MTSRSRSHVPSVNLTGLYLAPDVVGPHVRAWATRDLDSPRDGAIGAPALPALSSERIGQFAAGRRCAARALEEAGSRDVRVAVGEQGAPEWPAGYVGSIAHSKTIAWAAAASTRHVRAIGIDCEPVFDDAAMGDVVPLVMLDRERSRSAESGLSAQELATLVFSAKESLYKCLHPRVRCFFDFVDAEVVSATAGGALRVRLLRDLGAGFSRGAELGGRFVVDDEHVHTAIEIGAGETVGDGL
jgi:enterobactin synthetase component D